MKDFMLIIITFATFVFGYYIMKKVDEFIYENQCQIASQNRKIRTQVWIASETPEYLDSISNALETCSSANPYIEFILSSGKEKRLLQKLLDRTIDIILLSEETVNRLSKEFHYIRVPHNSSHSVITKFGLNVESMDEEEWVYVVWNSNSKSENRDRVIVALVNEYYELTN